MMSDFNVEYDRKHVEDMLDHAINATDRPDCLYYDVVQELKVIREYMDFLHNELEGRS